VDIWVEVKCPYCGKKNRCQLSFETQNTSAVTRIYCDIETGKDGCDKEFIVAANGLQPIGVIGVGFPDA
jgi:sarcosine oxidase delta subunit